MSVHYKFKSSLNLDKVTFDGLHISVGDLKKAIMQHKKIGKSNDFDLQITNQQTNEVYNADDTLIEKNTTVIVARVPVSGTKKHWRENEVTVPITNAVANMSIDRIMKSSDLVKSEMSEEEKIRTMINQSTQDYDSSKFIRTRPHFSGGNLPPNYKCYRCGLPGHYIKQCPTNQNEVKRSTGIPRSFMMPASADQKGALITPTGEYVVPIINSQAYKEIKKEKPPFMPTEEELDIKETPIPEELLCMICKNILQDAVMIPCCTACYCDECIRTKLIESEQHECPSCKKLNVSPDNLLPNRFLRSAVLRFRNETGFTKNGAPSSTSTTATSVTNVPILEDSTNLASGNPTVIDKNKINLNFKNSAPIDASTDDARPPLSPVNDLNKNRGDESGVTPDSVEQRIAENADCSKSTNHSAPISSENSERKSVDRSPLGTPQNPSDTQANLFDADRKALSPVSSNLPEASDSLGRNTKQAEGSAFGNMDSVNAATAEHNARSTTPECFSFRKNHDHPVNENYPMTGQWRDNSGYSYNGGSGNSNIPYKNYSSNNGRQMHNRPDHMNMNTPSRHHMHGPAARAYGSDLHSGNHMMPEQSSYVGYGSRGGYSHMDRRMDRRDMGIMRPDGNHMQFGRYNNSSSNNNFGHVNSMPHAASNGGYMHNDMYMGNNSRGMYNAGQMNGGMSMGRGGYNNQRMTGGGDSSITPYNNNMRHHNYNNQSGSFSNSNNARFNAITDGTQIKQFDNYEDAFNKFAKQLEESVRNDNFKTPVSSRSRLHNHSKSRSSSRSRSRSRSLPRSRSRSLSRSHSRSRSHLRSRSRSRPRSRVHSRSRSRLHSRSRSIPCSPPTRSRRSPLRTHRPLKYKHDDSNNMDTSPRHKKEIKDKDVEHESRKHKHDMSIDRESIRKHKKRDTKERDIEHDSHKHERDLSIDRDSDRKHKRKDTKDRNDERGTYKRERGLSNDRDGDRKHRNDERDTHKRERGLSNDRDGDRKHKKKERDSEHDSQKHDRATSRDKDGNNRKSKEMKEIAVELHKHREKENKNQELNERDSYKREHGLSNDRESMSRSKHNKEKESKIKDAEHESRRRKDRTALTDDRESSRKHKKSKESKDGRDGKGDKGGAAEHDGRKHKHDSDKEGSSRKHKKKDSKDKDGERESRKRKRDSLGDKDGDRKHKRKKAKNADKTKSHKKSKKLSKTDGVDAVSSSKALQHSI